MIEIKQYILEKLHLNKDTKLPKLTWKDNGNEIKQYIIDKVKEINEVDLSDIFNHTIKDKDGNDIETIYYEGDTFAYSYYEDYERYEPIDDLSDIFTGREIETIYNYLIENDKS